MNWAFLYRFSWYWAFSVIIWAKIEKIREHWRAWSVAFHSADQCLCQGKERSRSLIPMSISAVIICSLQALLSDRRLFTVTCCFHLMHFNASTISFLVMHKSDKWHYGIRPRNELALHNRRDQFTQSRNLPQSLVHSKIFAIQSNLIQLLWIQMSNEEFMILFSADIHC